MLLLTILSILFNGAVQHESLFPTTDVSGVRSYPRAEWAKIDHLSNTYADFGLRYEYEGEKSSTFRGIQADLRLEAMQWPMLGYEAKFRGYGVGRLSLQSAFSWGTITIGDVYGQFGSGLILRLYEERSLGIDNSLRGAKIDVHPYRGIHLTALGGKQRRYWAMYDDGAWGFNYRRDAALGANLELSIDEWSGAMQDEDAHLTIGASWVSKYQAADTVPMGTYYHEPTTDNGTFWVYPNGLRTPAWVGAWDVRANLQMKGWNALVEYAGKSDDPSIYTDYNLQEGKYKPRYGQVIMASLSYSRKGLSIIGQAKRTENMYFTSDRHLQSVSGCGFLNHLPAFANQHTYTLAALYPYATQMNGEWAVQGEIRYTFARKTKMGGKYGTTLKLNMSHVRGTTDRFFASTKDGYYTDVNLELNKKITKQWTLNAMAMYQAYNKGVIEGHGDQIKSGIFVADAKYAVTKSIQMRGELQYLYSKLDQGQWIFALFELSMLLPKSNQLMLSAQEQYCIGRGTITGSESEQGKHYYAFQATWTHGAHRLSAGYTKTRAGYNCSGGICRYVPKQEGVQIRYDFTW